MGFYHSCVNKAQAEGCTVNFTGTMPLVKDVGYVYASLPSVFSRMLCSSNGISRPWAVADAGKGAATATEAPARRREGQKDFMVDIAGRERSARTSERLDAESRTYTSRFRRRIWSSEVGDATVQLQLLYRRSLRSVVFAGSWLDGANHGGHVGSRRLILLTIS